MSRNDEKQDSWTCQICQHENPLHEDVCGSCGALKDEPCCDVEDDLID